MANTKISGLTEITNSTTSDVMEILDVSDTSFGVNGTNKKITKSNFLNGFDVDSLTATADELNQLDDVTVGGSEAGDILDTQSAQTGITGKTFDEITITEGTTSTNGIIFGSDTNLYRSAANALRSDDALQIAGSFQAGDMLKIYDSTAGTKGVQFGDNAGGYDTNLYRSAANTLKTDDTFNVGGEIITKDYTETVATSGVAADRVCDGTDDDVQIQAAIDAVEAAGGGIVFIRAGTYTISADLTIDTDNVKIIGEGRGSTTIQAKSSYSGTNMIDISSNYVEVHSLTIDGNIANNGSADITGVNSAGSYGIYRDLEIKDMNDNTSSGAGVIMQDDYNQVINCLVSGCEYIGILLSSAANRCVVRDCYVTASGSNANYYIWGDNNYVVNCISDSSGSGVSGFHLQGNEETLDGCYSISDANDGIYVVGTDCLIKSCVVTKCSERGLEMGSGADRTQIIGNRFIDNTKDAIRFTGSDDCVISNNVIDSNDGSDTLGADNSYSGIIIFGTCTRNVITGNRILQSGGTDNYQYGIREDSSNDDSNLIVGNIVTGAQTGQISTQGASTVSANNITA